jgi:hypothetical protein
MPKKGSEQEKKINEKRDKNQEKWF